MRAPEIVERIGNGVRSALETCQLFLGVEVAEFENADIHPEYVTTVKVAEKLTGPEYAVSLETHMKTIRGLARGLARRRNWKSSRWSELEDILAKYSFGKKDTQRLDILVLTSDSSAPPVLFAEAKLGAAKLPGIINDIQRILRLLTMYKELDLLNEPYSVYGAVVFHIMEEGQGATQLVSHASKVLTGVKEHLETQGLSHDWLKYKADLLHSGRVDQPISGYEELQDDGTTDSVFAKEEFSFAPGLVLLGHTQDIETVTF
jgi:hypothetical protein